MGFSIQRQSPMRQPPPRHDTTYPPSPNSRLNGRRPPGQTPCNHRMCRVTGQAIELLSPTRFSLLIFFPEPCEHGANPQPTNHGACTPATHKSPKLQALASRFIHSSARHGIATRVQTSPAIECLLSTRPPRPPPSSDLGDGMGGHDSAQSARYARWQP